MFAGLGGSCRTFELSEPIQDVMVAPSKHTRPGETVPLGAWRRIAVYAVVVIALLVVLWALIEGGERDLWTRASMTLPLISVMPSS